jgi:glycosyltransferase involved in cell wall biosynthesis
MMRNLAFIATGYIVEYDGISVYIENILKNLLLDKSVQNNKLAIDIYISKSAQTFFKQRVFKQGQGKNINIVTVKDQNSIIKIIDLQLKLLFSRKYDVVFIPNPMPLFSSSGKRVKVIHDLTIKQTPELFSSSLHRYIDFLIWYMYRFDDAIGYISNQTKDDIKKFYQIDQSNKKFLYMPNGIPFKVQNYQRPDMHDIYQKYTSKSIEFVVVGRINKSKGFDRILLFLNYFEQYLQTQNKFNTVTLHIVGKQTAETKSILKNANLKNIILNFHGYVDDDKLNNLYIKSQFSFFLSRNEGYGLPLVESMWLRCIPIISDIPIFNEILGTSYPKFSDESGYDKAIKDFIVQIFDDKDYLKMLFEKLENSVLSEKEGYKSASDNLAAYIENRDISF